MRALLAAIDEVATSAQGRAGDTLVFLPGEREIREAAQCAAQASHRRTSRCCRCSHASRLREQDRVLQRGAQRASSFATNVAETSAHRARCHGGRRPGLGPHQPLWPPQQDSARCRSSRSRRASADQRKGRAARGAWPMHTSLRRSRLRSAALPSLIRRSCARTSPSVIPRMVRAAALAPSRRFPFPDPPDAQLVADGHRPPARPRAQSTTSAGSRRSDGAWRACPSIRAWRASSGPARSTPASYGRPRALRRSCPSRIRAKLPRGAADRGGGCAARLSSAIPSPTSSASPALWRAYERRRAGTLHARASASGAASASCPSTRMREWHDLHAGAARGSSHDMGLREAATAGTSPDSRASRRLSGFIDRIGLLELRRDDRARYTGARGLRFRILPGSRA